MILWETQIKYKDLKESEVGIRHLSVDDDSKTPEKDWDSLLRALNRKFGIKCDPKNIVSVYICGGTVGCLEAIIAHPIKDASLEYCFNYIRNTLEKNYAVCDVTFEGYKEVSAKRFGFLGTKADDNGYIRFWNAESGHLKIDYFSNNHFKVEEYLEEKEYSTLSKAKKAGDDIMADPSLTEELKRIYSKDNVKKYYGNPVHYRISASSSKSALDIIDIIVPALIANNRLCGKRILHIHSITEGCYDENELEHLFESAEGNAVVIEMTGTDETSGNFASVYQRVVNYIDMIIEKHHLNTLCFFVEIKDNPGFTESLISKVSETLQIISINEGYGSRDQARVYLKRLIEKENLDVSETEMESALDEKKMFSVEDIYEIYGNWFKNGLRTHFYKAYSNYKFECLKTVEKSCAPYEELQKMIGLSEIKQIVDQIIDAGKIQRLRDKMGLSTKKASLHMVFTGNPGSAKTTVARLIAQILRKEGILDDGNFVECGRADLIARFVGWTAKNVRAKFREARGGILFIDEAYSLVDDSHSFADEAINTIVQEMENHREDVIVIFAGYPEKMNDFLNKNEGLKSRIAFHLDFPDYTADELTEIMKLMADRRGFHIDDDAIEKCMGIFKNACTEADFGNGRFVRNLLEQAEMAQSHRIAAGSKGKKISKKTLQTLVADDFDVNISKKTKVTHFPIGFAV
ncbi:MAG: AAA family ATPase [Lachnospiraceae bacterium]|nr:AAA family ATPase [Lachnospiraceae bacterium]